MNYASLCILAYKRPELLQKCIDSIHNTIDYPCEIIINFDEIEYVSNIITDLYTKNSKVIISRGKNRGVGRAFQNCLGLAEGKYIFKIDTDLIFQPKWLSTSVDILNNNPDIGGLSLFDYNHYDPNDARFKPENNIVEKREDCIIVNDFVSSIYAFRTESLPKITPVEDDGNHTKLGKLAITNEDLVRNEGFGVIKSTYVSGTEDHPYKTPTYNEPLIFKKELVDL